MNIIAKNLKGVGKELSFLLAGLLSFNLQADVVWETGSYTPSAWEPSYNNLLLRDGVELSVGELNAYTKDNPEYAESGALFDGSVPSEDGKSVDYTKVLALKSATFTWYLGEKAFDIYDIKVFSRWGDGGRDGISIESVQVSEDNENWTTLNESSIQYGTKTKDGNNNSAGALYARLHNSDEEAMAGGIRYVKIVFPDSQDNSGTGYVEVEVCGTYKDSVYVEMEGINTKEYSSEVHTIIKSSSKYESLDLYLAYGTAADRLVPQKVASGIGKGDEFLYRIGDLEHNTTYYYLAFFMAGDERVPGEFSGFFTTLKDNCRYLPKQYTQVEYIETTGTQCLDTGVEASSTISAELDFAPLELTGDAYLGTIYDDTKDWRFFQTSGSTKSKVTFDIGNVRLGLSEGGSMQMGSRYCASVGNAYLKVTDANGGIVSDLSANVVANENILNGHIYLAAVGKKDGYSNPSKLRIYSLVIKDDGEIVRDFVPCLDTAENAYGLYDAANKEFYSFTGTDLPALVAGDEVLPIKKVKFFRVIVR